MLSMLAALPPAQEGDGARSTYVIGDVDAAVELSGFPPPSGAAAQSDDDIRAWLSDISGTRVGQPPGPVRLQLPLRSLQTAPAAAARDLGWSFVGVHRYAWQFYGSWAVVDTDATADDLTAALGADTNGVWALGAESESLAYEDGFPELTSVRLGIDDGLLMCAGDAATVATFLADGPSLADNPAYVEALRPLDALGAYQAVVLQAEPFSLESYQRVNTRASQADLDARAAEPVPGRFDTLAIGQTVVDGEAVTTFVYRHADAASAAANAERIEEVFRTGRSVRGNLPYSQQFAVESVATDGNLVIVTTVGEGNPLNLLVNLENPVMWR